ncbi:MAG: calcium-translocating P-type ATPase, SERCA-type [Actinobacteria bacterium]|nr:calcium-translocating P-type ATPase, SERCA-type [Actinomycetota bacterium]
MKKHYYSMNIEEVLGSLNTSGNGLDEEEAEQRLDKYGRNEIEKRKTVTPAKIFFRQFTSFIVIILFIAIIISLLVGERLDAIVIAIILFLNGIFGFIQEYKAEKAIESLRKLTALKASVIRDGNETEIDSRELVPGDIIMLETGNKIPADARLLQLALLQVDEASLTGESTPSKKITEKLDKDTAINDQENMVFMGTIVTKGRAKAVVTSTGMKTEIGEIAELVQEVKEKLTPLQESLKQFGKWLGIVTIVICAFVFGVGVLREYLMLDFLGLNNVTEMFLASVALAVAAIPEGLPAIVTISLALGVNKMARRNVLLRQLPAVETLGCTNVICSDKTGTITKNEMTVREIFTSKNLVKVTGEGYAPKGDFILNGQAAADSINMDLLLRIGALCNDSRLNRNEKWEIFGDPTEGALIVSAAKAGLDKAGLEKIYPRVGEIPFDSERKSMTTVHDYNNGKIAYTKGAPDIIIDKCKYIYNDGKVDDLSEETRKYILSINQDMAGRALRVLGFAYKELSGTKIQTGDNLIAQNLEKDLVFVGLQAMFDPPREGVKESIEKCKAAGIKTVIITGDHKLTAVAVAKELGLYREGNIALSGDELDKLSDGDLDKMIENIKIFARVSPEHKVRILDALKSKGHTVAMTGDGVNDAPALKKADIGIAMGITGTDVAKEASDMVLTDDNFSSIVNAVEEGRGIYNSIKQFVQYTLSSNLGEILVIFMAILIGWPLPLIAIQILWVNLLTDGLPGLALGLDPHSKDIMKRPPRKREEKIISRDVVYNIAIVGFVMMIGTLFLFYSYGTESIKAKSIAFTTLVMFQLFNVLTYRAKNFRINLKTSKYLVGSVIITVILQIIVLYTPLSSAFKTVPISFLDWVKIIAVSVSIYAILEIRKIIINFLIRKKAKEKTAG